MKHILITLFLCVSSFCYSQDTLQIPAIELEEFFLALDTLETQDSIKTILISQLEKKIEFHLELNDQTRNWCCRGFCRYNNFNTYYRLYAP